MHYAVDTFPGREIIIKDESYLYFGGTSYLGLQTDTDFKAIFIKNIEKYGTNYGASRKSNIQLSIYSEVENHLASLVGSEACVTLSSGYLAGQLVAQTMSSKAYKLFYAPDTHAAIHITDAQTFCSYKELNTAVSDHIKNETSIPVVLLDTVDTEGINYPNFNALQKLPLEKIILIADDSHGIGVVGRSGSGAYENLIALNAKELIVCCSLGKGFGVQAGAIFGKKKRITQLMNTTFFGGASPATPASLATLMEAESIFTFKRKMLKKHILLFKSTVINLSKFKYIDNHPSFTFSNTKLAQHLEANNCIVTNFNYPTAQSPLMSRIVLSSQHTASDINHLVVSINSFKN